MIFCEVTSTDLCEVNSIRESCEYPLERLLRASVGDIFTDREYGIEHQSALTGVAHPQSESNTPLRVWTDGSLNPENGRASYAVWFGEGDPWYHAQRVHDWTEVFFAELHAEITALLLHDPTRDLEIHSDCENVVKLLSDELAQLRGQPIAAGWLEAARNVQRLRRQNGRTTKVIHVLAHILDRPTRRTRILSTRTTTQWTPSCNAPTKT